MLVQLNSRLLCVVACYWLLKSLHMAPVPFTMPVYAHFSRYQSPDKHKVLMLGKAKENVS